MKNVQSDVTISMNITLNLRNRNVNIIKEESVNIKNLRCVPVLMVLAIRLIWKIVVESVDGLINLFFYYNKN